MVLTDARPAGGNFVATGQQVIPGGAGDAETVVPCVDYVPAISEKMKAPFEMINEKVMTSSRFSHQIKDPSRVTPAGPVDVFINEALGNDFLEAMLGKKTALSAVAAAATSASNVSTGRKTVLTVPGTWKPGAHVLVNTTSLGVANAGTLERVALYGSGSGSLIVDLLPGALATAGAGVYATQPAQDFYANSALASAHLFELMQLTVEVNKGKQWSWLYGASFVDKLAMAFSATTITSTYDIVSAGGLPVYADAGTTPAMGVFAPSTSDMQKALSPWNVLNCQVAYTNDDDASGVSTLGGTNKTVTDIKVNYDNKMIKEAPYGLNSYAYFPGDDPACTFSFRVINTAKRNAVWEDLIRYSKATPLHIYTHKDIGAVGAPNLSGISLYAPNAKFDLSDSDDAIGKENGFQVTGESMVGPGLPQDLMQIFILKST